MAKQQDLTGEQTPIIGDDVVIRITLDEPGSIAGWTFDFVLKRQRDDPDEDAVVTDQTNGVSQTIEDAGSDTTNGVIDTTVADTVTDTLDHNRDYWYAIRRADEGFETTLVHGVWPSRRR